MQDFDLTVRIAWMYYDEGLTHAEIAKRLHINRVKVTRLLQAAREQGIVEIHITHPMPADLELSQCIVNNYQIQQAIVVPVGDQHMGKATADLLVKMIDEAAVIGFGWSRSVSLLTPYLVDTQSSQQATIVDLVGTMVGRKNPYSVSGQVAEMIHANLMPLPIPVLLSSNEARNIMLSEPFISDALTMARRADCAFVGVGAIGEQNTARALGIEEAPPQHAAGEILLRHFDIDGVILPNASDDRLIGLMLQELARIPTVVLVARGAYKLEAIQGALLTGAINILITDVPTAHLLVDES